MPRYVPTPVDDPVAQGLITEYFESRELGFSRLDQKYKIVMPDPAAFVPPAGVFLVVYDDDDEAVGCGGVRMIAPDRGEIKHLYLRESTRGKGWGRTLLTELEVHAFGYGARVVVLDTNASLEAAQQLYRTSGYVDIEPYNDNPNATNWFEKVLDAPMPPRRRLMFVQLKTGFDIDRGPSWIGWVDFNKTWKTARFHDKELRRFQSPDANFYDVETHEDYWLSGPKRDRTDLRYGPGEPTIDDDAREAYDTFLAGGPLPGREHG